MEYLIQSEVEFINLNKFFIFINTAFHETNNISAASRKLGISRTTIYKHLQ
ncbi:hypothetical protein IDH29_04480 [Pelagibacterales bacterium SAG-MED06]|nr:hypothetical protein [Pelagibacterales bacterium SAG-MED06]